MIFKKKVRKIYLIALFAIIFVSLIQFSISAELDTDTLINPINDAQDTFEKIPKTPEEIKSEYLKQEWNKIFSTLPIIGPIHNFMTSNPLIFKILFNEPYSISLTFILTLILWILTIKVIYKPSKEAFNNAVAWTISLGIALIFSHISLYKIVISKVLYLIYAQEAFWFRTALWILLLIAFIVIMMLDEILRKAIKNSKEAKEKRDLEEGIKESQTFIGTIKEYMGIIKKSD